MDTEIIQVYSNIFFLLNKQHVAHIFKFSGKFAKLRHGIVWLEVPELFPSVLSLTERVSSWDRNGSYSGGLRRVRETGSWREGRTEGVRWGRKGEKGGRERREGGGIFLG